MVFDDIELRRRVRFPSFFRKIYALCPMTLHFCILYENSSMYMCMIEIQATSARVVAKCRRQYFSVPPHSTIVLCTPESGLVAYVFFWFK